MNRAREFSKMGLAVLSFLIAMPSIAQLRDGGGTAPTIITANQTPFQQQTHFLTFLGSFVPESSATAKAYYRAIDPQGQKTTFTKWLVNAGFISSESQWHPYGAQTITSTPGDYGDNKVNADSHVIVLNAADLGFVRNQFIRCKPSCTALNPIIYTYLENYPVAPFAVGGSKFGSPEGRAFPTQDEAKAAIQSAIKRPLGDINGQPICSDSTTCIERIADVAFEWAPPPTNLSSSTRYGQLYAFVFYHDLNGITETISVPNGLLGKDIQDFATGQVTQIQPGDPFPPNLDGLGFKQHPGVCFICHGGKPQNLTSTGTYPRQGNVDEFRFLPLDIANLMFTSDHDSGDLLSRLAQEAQIKKYNKAVLITARGGAGVDDQGVLRAPHLVEAIRGWYAAFDGDLLMQAPTQNVNFVPKGWREPAHGGTARPGSENLYLTTVATSCRSCHFNRELSLDFGTAASFDAESDLLELTLLPECQSNNPDPKKRPMPLTNLTYQRMWQSNPTNQTVDLLKAHFGFTPTSYCASNP